MVSLLNFLPILNHYQSYCSLLSLCHCLATLSEHLSLPSKSLLSGDFCTTKTKFIQTKYSIMSLAKLKYQTDKLYLLIFLSYLFSITTRVIVLCCHSVIASNNSKFSCKNIWIKTELIGTEMNLKLSTLCYFVSTDYNNCFTIFCYEMMNEWER
jgi:hypothetical protein